MVDQVRNSPPPQEGDWAPGKTAPEYDGYYTLITLRNGDRFSFENSKIKHPVTLSTKEYLKVESSVEEGVTLAVFRMSEVVAIVRTKGQP